MKVEKSWTAVYFQKGSTWSMRSVSAKVTQSLPILMSSQYSGLGYGPSEGSVPSVQKQE